MKSIVKNIFFLSILALCSQAMAQNATRLKDLVKVKGVRENPIVGYGLVVGLNGTGDGGGEITNKSLTLMFQKLGLNPQNEISSNNVAAVIVTAKLPPFGRVGQKLDVTVSSIGDASSLAGGTLLVTPLKGGDGNVYAVASGAVSIGGMEQGQNFATTASIPSGAIVEREIESEFDKKKSIRISLNNPDFTTSARIERTINEELGGKYATSRDSATVDLIIPPYYERKVVQLLSIIENFKVVSDSASKIVINEKTGTIVAGGDITVSPVAISHGDLTIQVEGEGGGQDEGGDNFYFMQERTNLSELVESLNALGTTPEDLISIFQALKSNGALTGEIEML